MLDLQNQNSAEHKILSKCKGGTLRLTVFPTNLQCKSHRLFLPRWIAVPKRVTTPLTYM